MREVGVDDDTAPFADSELAVPGEFVPGPDAGREHHHVDRKRAAAAKGGPPRGGPVADERLGRPSVWT